MGNEQSSEEKWRRDAYTNSVLEKQRKFYEEKCKRLLEQAQSSQRAQVAKVEEAHVGYSRYQGSNTLYPNLNIPCEPQPHSSMNVIKIPTSAIAQNNYVPRSVASTSTTINSNLQSGINSITRAKAEEAYVGHLSSQGSNTLNPNLNDLREPQTYLSTNNVINTPNDIAQNNYIPRSVPSTSTTINTNIRSNNDVITRAMPSAPPEPSRQIQHPRKNKGVAPSARPEPSRQIQHPRKNIGVTPSARPEPSRQIQHPRKNKGPVLNKNLKGRDEFNCETCNKKLGSVIFQCGDGHSSCQRCKMAGRLCGKINCGKDITETRNRIVEALLAEMTLSGTAPQLNQVKAKFKTSCPNRLEGCQLRIAEEEMWNHLKECPFRELACPLASIFGRCSWRGRINHLTSHFIDVHPEHCQANVDTEMSLLDIKNTNSSVYLVAVGKFNFLVNIKVDAANRSIYFAIQFFGTSVSAKKWNYEFHVYNKSQPKRKYQHSDVCLSTSVPVDEIFNNNTCVVIPESYIKTFKNNGLVNYKFYIKRSSLYN